MICRNCGRENSTKSEYCAFCGFNFAGQSLNNADFDDNEAETKQKLIIAILLFVLIVILSLILVMVIKIGANNSTSDEGGSSKGRETVSEEVIEEHSEDGDVAVAIPSTVDADDSVDSQAENTDSISEQEYCAAYKTYIEQNSIEYVEADFIDVNGDNIYELVLCGGNEAAGNLILTYGSNGVDALQTNRLGFDYIQGENLLCNSDGHMGYYFDIVYSIENGKWVVVASGVYTEQYDDVGVMIDEYDNFIYEYSWNDSSVSMQTYYANLKKVYDEGRAVKACSDYSPDQITSMLSSGKVQPSEVYLVCYPEDKAIHTYEIVVADVSWSEAYSACNAKGGHLLHINSIEEYNYITELLMTNGMSDKVIWLGGRRAYSDEKYHWVAPYNNDNRYYRDGADCIDDNSTYSSMWFTGEPSYHSDDGQGNYFDERYMDMFYSSKQEKFVWNDTVDDILSVISSYRGKIAYICEYE